MRCKACDALSDYDLCELCETVSDSEQTYNSDCEVDSIYRDYQTIDDELSTYQNFDDI